VRLRFGIVRATGEHPADPVVYLSGGPGQGALELVPLAYAQLYGPLMHGRDLVIFDQRGTGLSEPSLACDEYVAWALGSISSLQTAAEALAEARQALDACRLRLVEMGIDLDDYNSAASAADLDALRQALGYQHWNVYGASYGTRLALTAMRDFPAGIRSVVLDSAYPVDANLYTELPENGERALDALFAACRANPGCNHAYPDLERTYQRVLERLYAVPALITLPDLASGSVLPSVLTGDAFAGFLFQGMYATELIPLLPELIAMADRWDFDLVGLLLGSFLQQIGFVHVGQQLAVQCQEEVAFTTRAELEEQTRAHPRFGAFLEGALTLGPSIADVCADWRTVPPNPIEDQPVHSAIPTLVLSGSLDPITPPSWGERVAAGLDYGKFLEFPHTGHGVINSRECGEAIVTAFYTNPHASLDTSCIPQTPEPAFTARAVSTAPFATPGGLSGVRPESWDQVLPGVFQEAALTSLVHQAAPGVTGAQLLAQIARQPTLAGSPAAVGSLTTPLGTWQLYSLDAHGQRIDLALTEQSGVLLIVQLSTTTPRRDTYYESVFLPAVRELRFPSAAPTP
jgi:pimeloyl-ACP methyl ester carboxylesterase